MRTRYEAAIRALLADFEARDEYLEDTPVADTVLALQVLAGSAASRSPGQPAPAVVRRDRY